jgi:hypothetical protein
MESLSNFLGDSDDLTKEDLLKELKEEGVDTLRLQERVTEIVRRESAKRRLAWRDKAKEKRLWIERMLRSREIVPERSDLSDQIRGILQGGFGEAALAYAEAYFRKKEDLSERDLGGLIKDLNDLNLLEELDHKKDA